jgi:hypothetical protein
MKKIEVLSAQKEVAINDVNELKNQLSQIESLMSDEKRKEMEIAFSSELESYDKVQIEMSKWNDNVLFMIDNKEIASLSKRHWYGSDANTIELNYYMTRCDHEFEFKRMMFIGKLSEKILYNQESLLHVFNTKSKYNDECNNIKSNLNQAEYEVSQINFCIQETKKQDIINALMGNGIEWDSNKTFELASKWSVNYLKNIKITNATKSGKTVDIECTFKNFEWSEKGSVEVADRIMKFESIKMDYVIGNFRDQIYK